MARIVVVGSINMDLVTTVERMPAPGETVHGKNFATLPGGKGANQAVAIGKLGGEVSLLARVGTDAFAEPLLASLRDAGVNTGAISAVSGPSGTATILVDGAGNNSIVVTAGANAALRPADIDAAREQLAGAMILAQLETPMATVLRLAAVASELRVPLMLDPAPAQALPHELLRNTTWLTPNETECQTVLRELAHHDVALTVATAPEAAQALLALGPRNVVLKLGAQGVYLAGADAGEHFIPALPVSAMDTTAAGDAFNGGFAYALAQGKPPLRAAEFACAVAAVSVTRAGAQTSMPTMEEVEEMLRAKSEPVR